MGDYFSNPKTKYITTREFSAFNRSDVYAAKLRDKYTMSSNFLPPATAMWRTCTFMGLLIYVFITEYSEPATEMNCYVRAPDVLFGVHITCNVHVPLITSLRTKPPA
jgi:hypothetical protein